ASMEVMNELVKANRDNTSVLMVTHSEKVAACSERVIYLIDGDIRGELSLGKMESSEELAVRERKLKNWLDGMDW
ncbi:MAG: ABC transporter ATP-binding protein, partial [Oscillospiraceae bacterium]|nr:ABC transporter ATP-binding protein [Oscillospiraceae bacterium]